MNKYGIKCSKKGLEKLRKLYDENFKKLQKSGFSAEFLKIENELNQLDIEIRNKLIKEQKIKRPFKCPAYWLKKVCNTCDGTYLYKGKQVKCALHAKSKKVGDLTLIHALYKKPLTRHSSYDTMYSIDKD